MQRIDKESQDKIIRNDDDSSDIPLPITVDKVIGRGHNETEMKNNSFSGLVAEDSWDFKAS